MAKYTINYACGHGSHVEQLYGKNSERERRIEWEEANRVCPGCYKTQLREADEKADTKAAIRVMCNGLTVTLRAEVTGQIERNREALAKLDIRRREGASGFLDMFSSKARWFCGTEIHVETPEQLADKGAALADSLTALGYVVEMDLDPMSVDLALAVEIFRKRAIEKTEQLEREKSDPRPPNSPLRERIAEIERETSSKWNGKLYGRAGSWNFYVSNVKHSATDAEVTERGENLKLHTAWKARNP